MVLLNICSINQVSNIIFLFRIDLQLFMFFKSYRNDLKKS
jgi:hypothetical protein